MEFAAGDPLHSFDLDVTTRGVGKAPVVRQQRRVERLRRRDIDSILSRQIVAQLPDARQQKPVRITANRKIGQIGERRAAVLRLDRTVCRVATENWRYLDVQQMGRVQTPSGLTAAVRPLRGGRALKPL